MFMRFQYVFWVLLILAVCLALWFARTPRVRIESYLYAYSEDPAAASNTMEEAMQAAAIVKSDEFVESIVSDPSLAQSELLKSEDAPAKWLKDQLAVNFDKQVGVPTFALIVPESFEQDGKRLVERISDEFAMRSIAKESRAAEQRRSELEAEFQELSAKAKDLIDASRGGVDANAAKSAKFETIRKRLAELSLELEEGDLQAPERIRIQQGTTVTKLGRW
jgi:hypothetical protein